MGGEGECDLLLLLHREAVQVVQLNRTNELAEGRAAGSSGSRSTAAAGAPPPHHTPRRLDGGVAAPAIRGRPRSGRREVRVEFLTRTPLVAMTRGAAGAAAGAPRAHASLTPRPSDWRCWFDGSKEAAAWPLDDERCSSPDLADASSADASSIRLDWMEALLLLVRRFAGDRHGWKWGHLMTRGAAHPTSRLVR